ncbi:cupredoxin domain-containing protein [Domibacillus robiginosus]|uniref:cupredoxin domain-containing protein n=1 Tax=Domibacillus robiginosus TaxID=1071054 RepID=UPI00067B6FA2|nr:cupredoxin domain-containing protein [Domibacillus robiginosus]
MSLSSVILTGNVLVFYFLTFVYIVKHKKEIPPMVGMMTAMTLGMLIGLLGGTILGAYFQGDLFWSTVTGGGLGFLAGMIIGSPLNLLTALEGMLSGLMGGMMGAMLGVMVSGTYIETTIIILFLLEFLFNLIVLYLLIGERAAEKEALWKKGFKNPILMSITMGVFFYFFNMSGPVSFSSTLNETASHENHKTEEKTEEKTDQRETVINTIEINADDFTYSPLEINVKKDQAVTIRFDNIGQVEHDLQLDGLNAELIEAGSHHSGEEEGVHIHAQPGEQSSIIFKPLENGTFEFYCTIPGHKESGMVGSLKVL